MHSTNLWNALKGIALILMIPALALFALFLWRKRASIAGGSATAGGGATSTSKQASTAANAPSNTIRDVTGAINAGTSLLNAFVGLIPSDADYKADASEPAMQSAAQSDVVGNVQTLGLANTAALA